MEYESICLLPMQAYEVTKETSLSFIFILIRSIQVPMNLYMYQYMSISICNLKDFNTGISYIMQTEAVTIHNSLKTNHSYL